MGEQILPYSIYILPLILAFYLGGSLIDLAAVRHKATDKTIKAFLEKSYLGKFYLITYFDDHQFFARLYDRPYRTYEPSFAYGYIVSIVSGFMLVALLISPNNPILRFLALLAFIQALHLGYSAHYHFRVQHAGK